MEGVFMGDLVSFEHLKIREYIFFFLSKNSNSDIIWNYRDQGCTKHSLARNQPTPWLLVRKYLLQPAISYFHVVNVFSNQDLHGCHTIWPWLKLAFHLVHTYRQQASPWRTDFRIPVKRKLPLLHNPLLINQAVWEAIQSRKYETCGCWSIISHFPIFPRRW